MGSGRFRPPRRILTHPSGRKPLDVAKDPGFAARLIFDRQDNPDELNPFKLGSNVYGLGFLVYCAGLWEGFCKVSRSFIHGDHLEVGPVPAQTGCEGRRPRQ